jgi:hypothetical protein
MAASKYSDTGAKGHVLNSKGLLRGSVFEYLQLGAQYRF